MEKYGLLTVLNVDKVNKYKVNCLCDCGNLVTCYYKRLVKGYVKSCGCLVSNETFKDTIRLKSLIGNMKNDKGRVGNKSGKKGITWDKDRCVWRVRLKIDKKMIYLGQYTDLKEAIIARENAEDIYVKPKIKELKKELSKLEVI